jgi:hypothetical protein
MKTNEQKRHKGCCACEILRQGRGRPVEGGTGVFQHLSGSLLSLVLSFCSHIERRS